MSLRSYIDANAAMAHHKPTDAQKSAGNYSKGHVRLHGLNIAIENARGSSRHGVDTDGKKWSCKLPCQYGYIKGTEGADGDHVDVFLGPHVKSPRVFVIDQNDADTGEFDEHKAFIGFGSKAQVINTYRKAFSDGRADDRMGNIHEMPVPEFKEWLKDDTTKPLKRAHGGRVPMASGGQVEEPYRGSNLGPLASGTNDWITPKATAVAEDWAAPPSQQPPKKSQDLSELSDLTTNFEKPSQVRAGFEGALSGASGNFRDELYGASNASGLPEILGGLRAPVGAARLGLEYLAPDTFGDSATKAYEEGRDRIRGVQKAAEKEYPLTSLAGNVAGAIALPVGKLAQAPTLPGRMAKGAGLGAGYGAVYGAGEGENLGERADKALSGSLTGAAVGAVAPPLLEGIGKGVGLATDKLTAPFRGLRDPEGEAARRVASALERDRNGMGGGFSLTPEEAALARQSGQPVAIADLGGEGTRALARSAANTSPEARQTLQGLIDPRFESQGYRASEFVRGLVDTGAEAVASKEAIKSAGSAMNKALYDASRKEFSGGIPWNEELATVAQTPAVIDAMKAAARTIENRVGAGRSQPALVGPDNRLTLEAWDIVKRNLDGKIGEAKRSGNKTVVEELDGVRRELVKQLDTATVNPETGISSYQKARGAAAEIFKATDAIEAGEKFLASKMSNVEARRAVAKMHEEERLGFAEGYASALVKKIHEVGYRRDIVNQFFNNPASRERAEIALGKDRAKQIEMFFRVESVMDKLRGAMGNSTTARQLAEMGLAGSAFGLSTGDLSPTGIMKGALLFKGVKEGSKYAMAKADNKVAEKVAGMLVSSDPSVLQKGIQLLNKNPWMMNNLRRFDTTMGRVSSQNAPNIPMLQGPVAARAEQEQQQP